MIQNENSSSKKIKENKYKILRMSLLLGQDADREETISNFCDAAIEIDSMNNETYLAELENKFYDTETLEEESKKLTELVDYIAGRISQRESLISDFINVTGKNLNNLGEIKYENRLLEYQERLKYINEYLDNSKKIEEETNELENLKNRLKEEEYQKEENEKKNSELENLLRKKFTVLVSNKIDIENLTEENIENEISELHYKTEESKKSLDIFTKSFETLKNAGISYDDEVEYKSYVLGARDIYYQYKEEEYFLTLYKLLLTNETEYSKVFNKRECINNILNERLILRESLSIKEEDSLTNIYNILSHQTQIVEGQKENIDNIDNITNKIKYIEERIDELTEENEKVEILAILKEYNIIDSYEPDVETTEIELDTEQTENSELDFPNLDLPNIDIEEDNIAAEEQPDMDIPDVTENEEETIELPINKPYKNNFIMGSHEPLGLNVDECIEKATSVMKRVGKMLNIEMPEETKEEPILSVPITEQEEQKEDNDKLENQPLENDTNKEVIPVVSPFVEPTAPVIKSPFIDEPEFIAPQEEKNTTPEESNVKKVLPSADSFWGSDAPKVNDLEKDSNFPDLTVSNDDFFANNMDNFEFPNLDEFK